jgi:hypothetical protein
MARLTVLSRAKARHYSLIGAMLDLGGLSNRLRRAIFLTVDLGGLMRRRQGSYQIGLPAPAYGCTR